MQAQQQGGQAVCLMAVHHATLGLWQRGGVSPDACSLNDVTVHGGGLLSSEKDRNPICPRPASPPTKPASLLAPLRGISGIHPG